MYYEKQQVTNDHFTVTVCSENLFFFCLFNRKYINLAHAPDEKSLLDSPRREGTIGLNSRHFVKHKRLYKSKMNKVEKKKNYEPRKYTIFHNKCFQSNSKRFTSKVNLRTLTTVKIKRYKPHSDVSILKILFSINRQIKM